MAYIVVLNPLIIGTAKDINGTYIGGGDNPVVSIALVAGATALVAGVLTIAMGAIGRFPLAIAAGLGLNSFLAFTIAPADDLAAGHGPGGPRGPHHLRPGAHRAARARCSTPSPSR